MLKIGVLILALSCLLSDAALAQEPATRAEADRKQREEKEAQTTPYQPNGVERAIKFAETKGIFILDREGFYPKLGSLTVGSGFAYGLGFRNRRLFENTGTLDLWAAASILRYNAVEARLTFPRLAGNHLHLETWGSRRDYPQENFFGLGPDSSRADRSDYGIRTNHVGGRAGIRPMEALLVGGGLEYLQPRLGPGNSSRLPDVSDVFDPSEVPGLETQSNFLRSDAFIEVDYREPRNARQGGWYRLDYSHYDDRKAGTFTFNRLDADVRQFIGFLAGRRVIAARLFVATSDATDEDAVPFYYMPTLGGNDTLRGFRQYRFQAPHAILFQSEYRWEIWSGLDGAVFYDAGKVANRRSDLDFANLERDYGFGFRFNTDNGVVFRVDAAFGSRDGKHLHIVFGGIF
jgi:Outer membrane protein/protective antigen OMA87